MLVPQSWISGWFPWSQNHPYKSHVHKKIPNFDNYFITRGEIHGLNLRNNADLDAVQIRREHGRSTVQRTGSVFWNEIPEDIKLSVSENVFKKNLFKALISKYEDWSSSFYVHL